MCRRTQLKCSCFVGFESVGLYSLLSALTATLSPPPQLREEGKSHPYFVDQRLSSPHLVGSQRPGQVGIQIPCQGRGRGCRSPQHAVLQRGRWRFDQVVFSHGALLFFCLIHCLVSSSPPDGEVGRDWVNSSCEVSG